MGRTSTTFAVLVSGLVASAQVQRIKRPSGQFLKLSASAKEENNNCTFEGSGNSSTDSGVISRDAILDSIDAEAVIKNCNRRSVESFPR
jgi:hypothetical protein